MTVASTQAGDIAVIVSDGGRRGEVTESSSTDLQQQQLQQQQGGNCDNVCENTVCRTICVNPPRSSSTATEGFGGSGGGGGGGGLVGRSQQVVTRTNDGGGGGFTAIIKEQGPTANAQRRFRRYCDNRCEGGHCKLICTFHHTTYLGGTTNNVIN
jgi:hypothetical protein